MTGIAIVALSALMVLGAADRVLLARCATWTARTGALVWRAWVRVLTWPAVAALWADSAAAVAWGMRLADRAPAAAPGHLATALLLGPLFALASTVSWLGKAAAREESSA